MVTLLSGELETPNGKGSETTVLANYTTSNNAMKSGESAHNCCRQYKIRLNRLCIRLNYTNPWTFDVKE